MAIRAGAGIAHDFIRQDLHQNTSTVSPFRLTVVNTSVSLDDPWRNYPGGDPFPLPYGSAVGRNAPWSQFSLVNVVAYNTPNMQATQYNLTIQRQIQDWVVSAGYLGTRIAAVHTLAPAAMSLPPSRPDPDDDTGDVDHSDGNDDRSPWPSTHAFWHQLS